MKAASVQPVNFESLQSSSETSIQLDYAKRYCNLRLAMFSMTILFSIMLLVIAVILIISNVVGMADVSTRATSVISWHSSQTLSDIENHGESSDTDDSWSAGRQNDVLEGSKRADASSL